MKYLSAFFLLLLLLVSCKQTKLPAASDPTISIDQLRADTARYQSRLIDVDADGCADEIFWHRCPTGDSLFVFRSSDSVCLLQIEGLAGDCLFDIDDIRPRSFHRRGFVVHEYFNGPGGGQQTIVLRYHKRQASWSKKYIYR